MRNNSTAEKKVEIELPHEEYPVEWWFFQGYYILPNKRHFEFMLSLFRGKVSLDEEPHKNGFSIIISLLDLETKINHTVSRIDNAVMESIYKRIGTADESDIDKDFAKVLMKEFEKHGPPRPIEIGQGKAEINLIPFEITWNDIRLKQENENFILDFTLPNIEHTFSFVMIPDFPRILLDTEKNNQLLNGEMFYAAYPQMKLYGFVNGEEVSGKAWLDHQWGNTCWFVTSDTEKRFVGWDWFGINFSDGTDIIIIEHKLMKTGEVLSTHATVRNKLNNSFLLNKIIKNPIRLWESPNTHIKYPVEWKIELPELEMEFLFEPYADNQEIQVLGVERAIWEGAGKVKGTYRGKQISGRARAEFIGYGYIFDFQNYLATLTDRVDKRILEYFPKKFEEYDVQKFTGKPYWKHEHVAYTEMLSVPVWDLLTRKGKRWRPIFGILLLEALGKSSEHYEASACLAELVHSGALIIDDIEDDSLLRRGEECIHIKYGLDVAINAGNTLYFLPTVELFTHKYLDDKKKLRLHEIMMSTYLQAHFGQTVDIYWSKYLTPENLNSWMNDSFEEKILQMYDYKTASGAKGLAEVASVIAEVNDEIKDTCIEFARTFAVSFQIIDDVHNFSNSPKWTKTCGEDLSNGKLTFAIVRAIKMLEEKQRQRLIEILCTKELRQDKNINAEGIELVRNSGALDSCREFAKKLSSEGNERFTNTIPSCEPKIMLNLLCAKMLDLAFDS